ERASAAEWTDLSPLHSTKQFFVDRAWRNWLWRRHWRFRGRRCLPAFFRRRSNRKGVETNGKQRRREQKTQSGRNHPLKVKSLPRALVEWVERSTSCLREFADAIFAVTGGT